MFLSSYLKCWFSLYLFFFKILNFVISEDIFFQIPHLRPTEYKRSRLARNRRTVNRAYGGVLSGGAVKERSVHFNLEVVFVDLTLDVPWKLYFRLCVFRIIRAFLVEEQKIVKKVLKIQKAKEKLAGKS